MKPIYLSMQGINSYTDKQEVFFDRLTESGLFCICGPTGGGKTTILDSIILALYGKGGRGRLSDYINLSSTFSELVFEFVSDGVLYRVERSFFKEGGKPSKCILTDKTAGKVLADQVSAADQKLRTIIGLPKEEFTQVAVIEQGKFSEFLGADKSSRNVFVGNLFRLDRFKNLYGKFNSKWSIISEITDSLREQAAEYGEVSDEYIKKLTEDAAAFKAAKKIKEDELKSLSSELEKAWAAKLEWENIIAARAALAEAEGKVAMLTEEITVLESKYNSINSYEKEAGQKKAEIEKNKLLFGALDGLKNTYDIKKKEEAKLSALTLSLKKYADSIADNEFRLQKKQSDVRVLIINIETGLSAANEIYRFDSQSIASSLISLSKLTEGGESGVSGYNAGELRMSILELSQKINGIRSELVRLAQETANKKASLKKIREEGALQQKLWEESIRAANRLKTELESLQIEGTKLKALLKTAQVQNSAAYIRSALNNGDQCPVCGGKVGNLDSNGVSIGEESIFDVDGETTAIESAIERIETALESTRKQLNASEGAANICAHKIEGYEDQSRQQGEELSRIEREYNEHIKDLRDEKELSKLAAILDRLAGFALEADKAREDMRALRTEGLALAETLARINEDSARAENEIKEMAGAIEIRTGGEDLHSMQKRIGELIARDADYVARFERSRQDTENAIRDKNSVKAGLLGEIKSIRERSEKSVSFDAEKFALLESKKRGSEEENHQLTEVCIKAEYEIKTAQSNLEKKQKLQKQIKENTDKTDKLSLILKIIKGDRFLEYVAEEYILRFTCAASEILSKISSGKYTIEYDDGTFYVRDFLMGNERRRASTLSGGETFLASLALAIAITREISGYKSFEFFFLDEGFGTLDSNSIDIVYEALESLSKETLVGIVTHRSELVDKIQNRLIIHPATETSGTRIEHNL